MDYSSMTSIATNSTLVLMDDNKPSSATNVTTIPSKELRNESVQKLTPNESIVFVAVLLSILVGLLWVVYKTRGIK